MSDEYVFSEKDVNDLKKKVNGDKHFLTPEDIDEIKKRLDFEK